MYVEPPHIPQTASRSFCLPLTMAEETTFIVPLPTSVPLESVALETTVFMTATSAIALL